MQAHERETLTAMVIADYLTAREPLRNACWIAEQDGVSVGASVLMAESGQSARNAALFRSFGFETRRDATGWEAALEGARRR
jgi:hypothetical protein